MSISFISSSFTLVTRTSKTQVSNHYHVLSISQTASSKTFGGYTKSFKHRSRAETRLFGIIDKNPGISALRAGFYITATTETGRKTTICMATLTNSFQNHYQKSSTFFGRSRDSHYSLEKYRNSELFNHFFPNAQANVSHVSKLIPLF